MADGTAGRAEGKREKWKQQMTCRFLPEHWINVVPSTDRPIIRMVTGLDGFVHVLCFLNWSDVVPFVALCLFP